MSEEEINENQMGLFEMLGGPLVAPAAPQSQPQPKPQPKPKAKQQATTSRPAASPAAARSAAKRAKAAPAAPAPKKVSGLVPTGDVRLTANIREDLHLKLKIASAYRRTTIGEIIEELIEQHV